ncbi:uncharacterized protein HMPREF1541_05231 [Cyphellophora europaea CBS 101466]|uniref:Uncharacterized protein n=1 Tax=Cyphellophora europaea (strain CBS 101466) TaxID=1220924 RepID=W2RWT7_CYPE1|nr:uncharacterized protein HMPREF1541_05231 [Cyphellophora europaea CBS 101466]ETN40951.1 hypothetical protein HMPREF1541_05231 [Cyphellophora europaea CBS 101466]
MAPSVDPSQWTYTDYVCFLRSHGFHNLGVLDEYLEWGLAARNSPGVRQPEFSRTMLLEFTKNTTRLSDLSDLSKLRLLLREWTRPSSPSSPGGVGPTGRTILIENPAPALIDTLGGLLNIDPTFFANHLDDSTMNVSSDSSATAPLASTTARLQRDFFTLDYLTTFIPLHCPKDAEDLALQCKSNYPRRIELIQKHGRQKVAVARRKISFYLRKSKSSQPWLSIILVDPPISKFTASFSSFGNVTPSQQFPILPYQGGYLDFIEMRKPLSKLAHDFRDCRDRHSSPSPFDDLIRHFQIQCRDGLFLSTPQSLATYMRPCVQLAAAETSTFLSFLSTILSQPLPTHATSTTPLRRALDRCIALDTLLSSFKPRLSQSKDFVSSAPAPQDLQADYRGLLSTLHHHRGTIDAQLQQITTLLQTLEAGALSSLTAESTRRADYLRYLVILSLVYLPFGIAYIVFSLPTELAPARHYLGAWVPVTAAVAVLFVLLVLPEAREAIFGTLGARACGGLTSRKLLRGERFRRNKNGVRTWLNSSGRDEENDSVRPETAGTWATGGDGSLRTKAWNEV